MISFINTKYSFHQTLWVHVTFCGDNPLAFLGHAPHKSANGGIASMLEKRMGFLPTGRELRRVWGNIALFLAKSPPIPLVFPEKSLENPRAFSILFLEKIGNRFNVGKQNQLEQTETLQFQTSRRQPRPKISWHVPSSMSARIAYDGSSELCENASHVPVTTTTSALKSHQTRSTQKTCVTHFTTSNKTLGVSTPAASLTSQHSGKREICSFATCTSPLAMPPPTPKTTTTETIDCWNFSKVSRCALTPTSTTSVLNAQGATSKIAEWSSTTSVKHASKRLTVSLYDINYRINSLQWPL